MTLKLSIPLRTGRGLNDRMHFMVRARKVKAERLAVGLVLNTHKAPAGPVTVNLGRVSPSAKGLDKDNLQGALKAVRDQVAACAGAGIQSLRMAASSGTGERTTGVARVAQLAYGGDAQ